MSTRPKKLWGGAFKEKVSSVVEDFTASIAFDRRLAGYDIDGSIAHVMMLARCRIISLRRKTL